MIPRPLTADAARHNPGRWICNKRPEKCTGIFRVYGQDMPCPLRAKCFWGRRNTYEWTPGEMVNGRFPVLDTDAGWRRRHDTRLKSLERALFPNRNAEMCARYRAAHREQLADSDRARYQKRHPPDPPLEREVKRPLLPCGEDCDGGCPYEACPYTDADLDDLEAAAKQERLRQQSREKYRRQKAREAEDPKYKAHRRIMDAIRSKRYRESHKDVLRIRRQNKLLRKDEKNDEDRDH